MDQANEALRTLGNVVAGGLGGGGSLQRQTTCAVLLQRCCSLKHNTWLKGHPLGVLFVSFLICWLERFLRLCD